VQRLATELEAADQGYPAGFNFAATKDDTKMAATTISESDSKKFREFFLSQDRNSVRALEALFR